MTRPGITDATKARQLWLGLQSGFDWSKSSFPWEKAVTELGQRINIQTPAVNNPIPFETSSDAREFIEDLRSLTVNGLSWFGSSWSVKWDRAYDLLSKQLAAVACVTLVKGAAVYTASQISDRLEKHDSYYLVGSGAYSKVYRRIGSTHVIKVCTRGDPVIDYLLWAHQAGWAGTFAPRIYSARRFSDYSYVVEMESLEIHASQVSEFGRRGAQAANFRYLIRGREAIADAPIPDGLVEFTEAFRSRFDRLIDEGYLDIHYENLMIRHNGCLVLTDPFTGETRSELDGYLRFRAAA